MLKAPLGWCLPGASWKGRRKASSFKLDSMDENLWGAVIISCSDGGETKKQPWHPQAGAGFAQEL